jgi:MarR family transcriptional regulator, organic hydroperoxide resistance regulator
MTDRHRPAAPNEALAQEISDAYHEVFDTFYSRPSKTWLELQLSLPQWKTLVLIAEGKSSTIGAVASRMAVGEPTASHLVDKLVQAGLVVRAEDPEDRRRTLVSVSAEGHRLIDELIGPRREMLREATRSLEEKDLKDLLRLIRKIGESMVKSVGEGKKGDKA